MRFYELASEKHATKYTIITNSIFRKIMKQDKYVGKKK